MKRYVVFIFLLAAGWAVSGCDFFRTIAGRPTSAELERKRQEIVLEQEEAMKAEMAAEQHRADSAAAVEALGRMDRTLTGLSGIAGARAVDMEYKYYIIVGSFQSRENAERQLSKANKEGFEGMFIQYRPHLHTVGICPSNDIVEAYKNLQTVRKSGFCPEAWILVNE